MRVQSYADAFAAGGALQAARAAVSSAPPEGRSRGRRGADRQKRLAERDPGRPGPRGDAAGRPLDGHPAANPQVALATTLARIALATGQEVQTSRHAVIEVYADRG